MADQDGKPPGKAASYPGTHYKGFVAGIFSGISKLAVGHPFDTIKVRLQTSPASQFSGPWACLTQTVRNEGVLALYKGATPPLIGWMFMDSVMLGSLTVYRRLLSEHVFSRRSEDDQALSSTSNLSAPSSASSPSPATPRLPLQGHAAAGLLSGWTVSLIAAPVEHVKARLQVQYSASRAERFYGGPIDCARRIVRVHGVRRGLYRGLGATLVFRSGFGAFWVAYDVFSRWLGELDVASLRSFSQSIWARGTRDKAGPRVGGEGKEKKTMSTAAINFWAGGLAAQVFWIVSYPADVLKQRIMTEPLGGGLGDGTPRYDKGRWRWGQAARAVYVEGGGIKAFWRGFLPCFLRSFPANAMAIMAFEGVMRALP